MSLPFPLKTPQMRARYLAIWFRYLPTDVLVRQQPHWRKQPLVWVEPEHGTMRVRAASPEAQQEGVYVDQKLADARALVPALQEAHQLPQPIELILHHLGLWLIRFSPDIHLHPPDTIFINSFGCDHLWGGEEAYMRTIHRRMAELGFYTQVALADTPGAAWACAHYGKSFTTVPPKQQNQALAQLSPIALRIPESVQAGLTKLGFLRIEQLLPLPASSLRKRFGEVLVRQLHFALGDIPEWLEPIHPPGGWMSRFPCLHPVRGGNEIRHILQHLLTELEHQLGSKQQGARHFRFTIFRVDNKRQSIDVETQLPTSDAAYLLRLFEARLPKLDPHQGIELFQLDTPAPEPLLIQQERCWTDTVVAQDTIGWTSLLDRLHSKLRRDQVQRYVVTEKHWPELACASVSVAEDPPQLPLRLAVVRPMCLLDPPEPIGVSAPVPDYPPMLFRYAGEVHRVVRADGPERIEQPWWIHSGQHRDYYLVEDEFGRRYWIFRLGHYQPEQRDNWFLHGYCP